MNLEDRIRALLKNRGWTITGLAEALDINRLTLYRKIKGDSEFSRREIGACCLLFGPQEVLKLFFTDEISQKKHNTM